MDVESEISKLWDRVVAAEEKLTSAPKSAAPATSAASGDLQTLVSELKVHGIHSSLYVEPAPAPEAQGSGSERYGGSDAYGIKEYLAQSAHPDAVEPPHPDLDINQNPPYQR